MKNFFSNPKRAIFIIVLILVCILFGISGAMLAISVQ